MEILIGFFDGINWVKLVVPCGVIVGIVGVKIILKSKVDLKII